MDPPSDRYSSLIKGVMVETQRSGMALTEMPLGDPPPALLRPPQRLSLLPPAII